MKEISTKIPYGLHGNCTGIARDCATIAPDCVELVERAVGYKNAALAPNTRRTYDLFWKQFCDWCGVHLLIALPASTKIIAIYLAHIGPSVSFSTLNSVTAAIIAAHKQAGVCVQGDADIYETVRKGIRRTHTENQAQRQAKALSAADLSAVCQKLGDSLVDTRDRLLLTLSFWGAMRRSELVGLDVEHLQLQEKGLVVTLLHSKGKDTATQKYLSSPLDKAICPIEAYIAFALTSGLETGALFRPLTRAGQLLDSRLTGASVSLIYKRYFGEAYSGHSGRRGLITEAAEAGASIPQIQRLSGHKSANMIFRYVEEIEAFKNTAAQLIGS